MLNQNRIKGKEIIGLLTKIPHVGEQADVKVQLKTSFANTTMW